MTPPLTISCAGRISVINGKRVHIMKEKLRNKKRPLLKSAWPDTDMGDPIKAFTVGMQWAYKGFIDDDLVRH